MHGRGGSGGGSSSGGGGGGAAVASAANSGEDMDVDGEPPCASPTVDLCVWAAVLLAGALDEALATGEHRDVAAAWAIIAHRPLPPAEVPAEAAAWPQTAAIAQRLWRLYLGLCSLAPGLECGFAVFETFETNINVVVDFVLLCFETLKS
jgi:hypothetical protein